MLTDAANRVLVVGAVLMAVLVVLLPGVEPGVLVAAGSVWIAVVLVVELRTRRTRR